jgi:hypothetical protein
MFRPVRRPDIHARSFACAQRHAKQPSTVKRPRITITAPATTRTHTRAPDDQQPQRHHASSCTYIIVMGLDDEIVDAAFGRGARRETIVGRQSGESRRHSRGIATIDGKAIVTSGARASRLGVDPQTHRTTEELGPEEKKRCDEKILHDHHVNKDANNMASLWLER